MRPAPRENVVWVEVSIAESLAKSILLAGTSLADFAHYVVAHAPVDDTVRMLRAGSRLGAPSRVERLSKGRLGKPEAVASPEMTPDSSLEVDTKTWERSDFDRLLRAVEADRTLLDVMALLLAYSRRGASPTSGELRVLCGFTNDKVWTQSLRAAKTRLGLRARRLGLTSPFIRPQTSRNQRHHPIAPEVVPWLRDWAADPLRAEFDLSVWGRQADPAEASGGI